MIAFALTSDIELHWLAILADATVKGLMVLLIAAAATLLLRRSSAVLRHMIWALALAALLLMPALSIALPQLHVPLLPDWSSGGEAQTQASPSAPAESTPGNIELPRTPETPTAIGPAGVALESELPRDDDLSSTGQPPAASSDELADVSEPRPPAPAATTVASKLRWSAWVLLAWLTGAIVLLLPLLAGTAMAWWQTRRAERIESGSWASLLSNLCRQLGIRGRVVLLRSDWSNIPLACGIFRPAIILPTEADDWPMDRRKVVLLHELAHIRRADCRTQLLARLARVIYWFNPLVWLAGRMRPTLPPDVILSCRLPGSTS